MKRLLCALLAAFSLSCSDKGGLTSPLLPPDLDPILELVYSSYQLPEGFYRENLVNSSLYYVNTVSTTPPASRSPDLAWIELATNDYLQARAWSDSSDAFSSEHRTVISYRETERFFEFVRVNPLNPQWTVRSRVHKSTYLAWCKRPWTGAGEVIGVWKKHPSSEAEARALVEYLWFIRNYDLSGAKVLSVTTGNNPSNFAVTLLETAVSYGDWGLRDLITVYASVYKVDRTNGDIRLERTVVKTIEGKQN